MLPGAAYTLSSPRPDNRAEHMASPSPGRIIVVDDDELFSESIRENLSDAGYSVKTFADGPSVLAFLDSGGESDLLLLDWRMPGMNGIEVLRQLRAREHDIPVIFLTVLSDQIYEEAGLLGGAVDFVEKSRSFSILLKRLELILTGARAGQGRSDKSDPEPRTVGNLTLLPDSSRALWRREMVELTLTEFRVVDYLASRVGTDVRYRDLYDLVRGEGFVAGTGENGYRANVRTLIKRVRQKFRALDEDFDEIENYPGFGYRWRAPGGTGG